MDNNNGALSFDVLIRDSNIEKMLAKDEQRIKDFTENVEQSSESIVQSFGNIGTAVAGLAIGATLKSWVSDIINVRGEFQQLEIALARCWAAHSRRKRSCSSSLPQQPLHHLT